MEAGEKEGVIGRGKIHVCSDGWVEIEKCFLCAFTHAAYIHITWHMYTAFLLMYRVVLGQSETHFNR